MSDFNDFLNRIPLFTRYWLMLTAGFTLIGKIGLINPLNLILIYEPLIKQFHIWRPFTAVFFYPLNSGTGFTFLINCYFLYNYSSKLETGKFEGRPADYLFLLLFNWICAVIVALFFEMHLLMDILVLSVLYIWCQLNKDVVVRFWFGSRFRAMYLPWVLLAFNLIVNNRGIYELTGIIIGHVYFFLMFKWPQELNGQVVLSTPSILYKYFPNTVSRVEGFGAAPIRRNVQQAEEPRPAGHNWGRGYTLGGR